MPVIMKKSDGGQRIVDQYQPPPPMQPIAGPVQPETSALNPTLTPMQHPQLHPSQGLTAPSGVNPLSATQKLAAMLGPR